MNKPFSDLPTTPMPVARPPRRRRKAWLIVLALVGVALIVGVGAGIVVNILSPSHSQASHTPPANGATATAQSEQNQSTGSGASVTMTAGTTSTPSSAPASTPQPGPPSITHGRPHLGGPFSDFVGKYGSPGAQGDANGQEFWVGPNQTIDITVGQNEQGKVTQLEVLGSDSWDQQQAKSYCAQFLPDGATQTSSAANLVEYRSSLGQVDLSLQNTSCSLAFAHN